MIKQRAKIAVLLVVIAAVTSFAAIAEPFKSVFAKEKQLPVYSVETDEKKISISFDCARGVEHTDEILSALKEYDVVCTFFAVEFWVRTYPEYAKKIVDAGHELQTHSSTHSHMSKMSVESIKAELITSCKAIEDVTGQKVTLFRCPFGEYDNDVILTARALGLQVVQWDVDSLDWKDLTADQIAARVLSKTKSGSIILCHNNGKFTAKALPLIFAALKGNGFTFVKISDLVYFDDYKIDANGRQKRI